MTVLFRREESAFGLGGLGLWRTEEEAPRWGSGPAPRFGRIEVPPPLTDGHGSERSTAEDDAVMDAPERIVAGLPFDVEEIEADGRLDVSTLWTLARAYSRLRHRTSPKREAAEHRRFDGLKTYCVRLAVSREPDLFLVFVDPGTPHLRLVYHRVERTMLHLPIAIELRPDAHRENGAFGKGTSHDQAGTLVSIHH